MRINVAYKNSVYSKICIFASYEKSVFNFLTKTSKRIFKKKEEKKDKTM